MVGSLTFLLLGISAWCNVDCFDSCVIARPSRISGRGGAMLRARGYPLSSEFILASRTPVIRGRRGADFPAEPLGLASAAPLTPSRVRLPAPQG